MRHLATIRKIDDIQPIPDADAIEVALLGGWKVVVKKGEFEPGNLVIYCEVDSFIPHDLAPFLTKGDKTPFVYEGISGERLRTVRLRGQVSQGLVLPIPTSMLVFNEGEDVTDLLGIVKYEPPIPAQLAGVVKGDFPSVFPKTDEERIQNLTCNWEELKQLTYEVTEKLEGSSMSVGRIDSEFIVCSRNLNLRETEGNSLWAQARKYNIEQRLIETDLDDIIIQGEIIGEGIQGNHYGLKGQDFYVFTVYDIKLGCFLSPNQRRQLCEDLGLKHVPVIHEEYVFPPETSVQDVLSMADGTSKLTGKLREGEVYKRVDGREHWKAVSNEYLFKYGRG
jgi:RNA ligase (TIGR02306 family)